MKKIIIYIKEIADVIFDKRCLICKNNNISKKIDIICDECYESLDIKDTNTCSKCGHPVKNDNLCPSCSNLKEIFYDSYQFIQFYKDNYRKIVKMWKMDDNFMVNKLFLKILLDKKMISKKIPIISVPDNPFKQSKKGRCSLNYLLKILEKSGCQIISHLLKRRILFSKSQKLKNKKDRLSTIEKVFNMQEKYKNKYNGEVYLIDDIYTTGSTMNHCSKLLKEAGFSKVHCISFFRSVMED